MSDINYEAVVNELRNHGWDDQKIADNLRSTGAESDYKQLLPNAKFGEETASQQSKTALDNTPNSAVSGFGDMITANPKTSAAVGAAAAAGLGYGAYKAGQKAEAPADAHTARMQDIEYETAKLKLQQLKNQVKQGNPSAEESALSTSLETPETPVQKTPQQILQERVDAVKAANLGVKPPAAPTYNQPLATTPNVAVPVATAPQGSVPPAQQGPVTVTEAVVTGQNPAQAIQKDLAQQIDTSPAGAVSPETALKKRAAKTTVNFKAGQALPEGTVFRSDLGNLDRSLFNILGPEHRRNAMEMLNEGKPFGNVTGDANALNTAVKDITGKYWKSLQEQIPETILDRSSRQAQGIKAEFGNYGSLGKAVKVAGIAGTLMTIADLAKASQLAKEGQYLEATKLAAPAVDPTGLSFAAVNPAETSQMLTNASPVLGMFAKYLNMDVNDKQKQKYKDKIGSGRGVAPPSAYMR